MGDVDKIRSAARKLDLALILEEVRQLRKATKDLRTIGKEEAAGLQAVGKSIRGIKEVMTRIREHVAQAGTNVSQIDQKAGDLVEKTDRIDRTVAMILAALERRNRS